MLRKITDLIDAFLYLPFLAFAIYMGCKHEELLFTLCACYAFIAELYYTIEAQKNES